jgi:hypothetical protein
MIEIEFPIEHRMEWVRNPESLELLTYEQGIDDLMSCLDNSNDCIYGFNQLVEILAEHWDMSTARLIGAATFGLADLKERTG